MKKLNKVAVLFASAALAAPIAAHSLRPRSMRQLARRRRHAVWKNGTNELCWRDANWTPATAYPGCDGALKPPPPPPPAPRAAPPPPPPAAGSRRRRRRRPLPPPAPVSEKVTFAADAFFDFDKSVLKPEAQGQAGRPGRQDQGHQPRSHHRRRPHRLGRHRRLQPEAVGAPCRSRQGLPGRARASRRTASTPKARARSSRSPTTRPPKAAPRTAAWKSKWSAPAPRSDRACGPSTDPASAGFC